MQWDKGSREATRFGFAEEMSMQRDLFKHLKHFIDYKEWQLEEDLDGFNRDLMK